MSEHDHGSPETKAVHAGIARYEHLPVVPPIYQVSTFAFESAAHGAALFADARPGYIYTRMGNPTVEALETAVAELEGGYRGLACGSGMAAIHTALVTLLQNGDHIICSEAVYGPTCSLVETYLPRFGIEQTIVDTSSLDEVRAAFKPNTRVVFIETPGNPTLAIADLEAISEMAHKRNALVVVDNTFMSPICQQPMRWGVDVVVHSLTKFLNGHADVVGGVIVPKEEEHYTQMRKALNHLGGVLPPFESFLVHRGLKTLALRMERHNENALKVAQWLESRSEVEWVRYPVLKSHPQHELARKQMSGGGGIVSFELRGGLEAGRRMMDSVKLCTLAVSLGGVESLIQHPASMTHATMGRQARVRAKITDGLVRISVGIENVDEIIADLEQALQKATALAPRPQPKLQKSGT